jgi:hypothetical protein
MDRDAFWSLVEDTRSKARGDEDFLRRIAARLEKLDPDGLMAFETQFKTILAQAYSWRLWGAAYLICAANDDWFDYFRAWLVAQGREAFERAVEDPDSLALLPGPKRRAVVRAFEELLMLAPEIYESRTDEEMPDSVYDSIVQPGLGERWSFDDAAEMKKRYPKLFAKYVRA